MLPHVARLSSNPPAYQYLIESIMAWPDQRHLADLMHDVGWKAVGLAQPERWHRRPAPRVEGRLGERAQRD